MTVISRLIGQFPGELAALTAAFLWAASSVIYTFLGQTIPPLQLNFLKGIIAIAFLVLTLVWLGEAFLDFKVVPVTFLVISGVIGIGLGDTAYFFALNNLGARRTLLLETLAPPLGALLALIFLQEQLSVSSWCGILLTLLGVAWVISERIPVAVGNGQYAVVGIVWGVLAAIAQATGAVLSRYALVESTISPLWSTLLRLMGGTVIVFILLLLPFASVKPLQSKPNFWSFRLLGTIALTAFVSTYLGIWLQQTSLKFAPTGIAQTLLATSPLFVLPIAAVMGERISIRAFLGVLIAIAGIGLLFIQN
ncbi:DMT family transporter [Pleurocapsales cyanobacterium LEGE 06147]|nr:DMT family transporter [Pleurocapsales cyanobacterium LEGE 06147]